MVANLLTYLRTCNDNPKCHLFTSSRVYLQSGLCANVIIIDWGQNGMAARSLRSVNAPELFT